jgi:hypothetical protein
MGDDEVTSGGEGPDPLAAFSMGAEFDDGRDEPSAPAQGSHRRGMLAGLAVLGVLLAVLVVVAPGGSRPKLAPQVARAVAASPLTSAAAAQPSSDSTITSVAASSPDPGTSSSSGSRSPSSTKTGSTASNGAGAGQGDVVTGPQRSGVTSPSAGGVGASPIPTSAGSSAPPTTAPAPPRTTSTTSPPRTTTTTAPARTTTTTTSAPPPTTTTTTICVLIVCL